MKAFLLAAGLGSRLRPLTDTTPKCMLAIDDRLLLDIWLESLAQAGVDEVTVNTHHLSDMVWRHLAQRRRPPSVRVAFEPVLLGSAGTLLANRDWVQGEDLFLVCYADNLTDFDLGELIDFHQRGGAPATLTVFRADNPSACGIVETDGAGLVVGFVEKPETPTSNLANAGIYAMHPSVIDQIEGPAPKDIGYDLLPKLVGQARAFVLDAYLRDIGTLAAYRAACQEWRERFVS
ncbi:MAG TPA: nucleotidyltransferase family protein [Acidimicrobiales bacterium]|nr:nucleotidyltransferase family protein [Acidimicrobiales bacterium]